MNKILTTPIPTEKADMAYIFAVMSTMRRINPTKEAPAKGEMLAYYSDTRVFTGVSPVNLNTMKEALKDEVKVVHYDSANKFMEGVAAEYFRYLDTLPEREAEVLRLEMLAKSTAILEGLQNKKRTGAVPPPNNCGEGTLRIQGRYPAGGKFVQDVCLACAKAAIAGDPARIQMFNDPKSIQGLLMAVMGEASLQRIV